MGSGMREGERERKREKRRQRERERGSGRGEGTWRGRANEAFHVLVHLGGMCILTLLYKVHTYL